MIINVRSQHNIMYRKAECYKNGTKLRLRFFFVIVVICDEAFDSGLKQRNNDKYHHINS